MTFDEYHMQAMSTCAPQCKGSLSYSVYSLAGEVGEFIEHIKKARFHETPLDKAKLILELGDILWSVSQAADALDTTLGAVAQVNIVKLRTRFPGGYRSGGGNREE